jgi:hypothetical protein
MGYIERGSLAGMVRQARDATERAAHDMADAAGADMSRRAIERTPSAKVAATIHQKPVAIYSDELGRTVYESGAETSHYVARFLEYGTGIYGPKGRPIKARKGEVLRFEDPATGEWIYATEVVGQRGTHAFAIAAAETEAAFHELVAPVLERWKEEASS